MQDVEISNTHLKFKSENDVQMITLRNNRSTNANVTFRLLQSVSVNPARLLLKPLDQQLIKVQLTSRPNGEDFFYIKIDAQEIRVRVSLESKNANHQSLDDYMLNDSRQRIQESPQGHLETFGNTGSLRSQPFLAEENKILLQRVSYLTEQNKLLNDALETFMNQEIGQQQIQQLVNDLVEQERQEMEYRSQRVLLMIEEKDREIQQLKFNSTQSQQVRELIQENERLQIQIQDLQAREQFYHSHEQISQQEEYKPEQESYVQLYKKYEVIQRKLKDSQLANQQLQEEVEIIAQRLDQSNVHNISVPEPETRDQLVNRLNARITQLKLREEQLLEENALLEDKILNPQQEVKTQSKHNNEELLHKEIQLLDKSNREFKYKNNDLHQQLSLLQQQISDLQKENKILVDEQWKSIQAQDKAQNEIKKYSQSLELTKQERIELESQIFALEQTLKQTNQKEIKEQANKKWEKEVKRQSEQYQAEILILEDEMKKTKIVIKDLKSEIEQSNQTMKQLQSNYFQSQQLNLEYEKQLQETDNQNKKLLTQKNHILQDYEKLKTDILTSKDAHEQELKRKDHVERQLQDRVMNLQDAVNNIMKEKQVTQSELQLDMNKLCQQHKQTIDQILQDNKQLELKCMRLQEELGQQKLQLTTREDQLIREVRQMQDKIESLVREQKAKKKSKSVSKVQSPTPDPLEEERKRVDTFMIKIKTLEEELNRARSQKLQLEYDLQHQKQRTMQAIELQQTQTSAQVAQELLELRDAFHELRSERENIQQQIIIKDDTINQLESQIQEYNELVQSQQKSMHRLETTISQFQNEFKDKNEKQSNETHKLKVENELLNEQQLILTEQIQLLQNERREISEKYYCQGFEIDQLKQQTSEEDKLHITQKQELKQQLDLITKDHKDNVRALQSIKQNIDRQREVYEETIIKQNNWIAIAKERFTQDLQEIQTKMNQYFNQNESIKKSLPSKEAPLFEMIQSYNQNLMKVAQNQGAMKMVQDKNKTLILQNDKAKIQIRELQEQIASLNQANVDLQKKVEKFKPKIGSLKMKKETIPLKQQVNELVVLQEGLLTEAEQRAQYYESQVSLLEVTVQQINEVNKGYETEIKKLQSANQLLQDSQRAKDQSLNEMQRTFKSENQKLINEMSTLQNKLVPEDKVNSLQDIIKEKEAQIASLKDELIRKKDVADQFRYDRDEKQQLQQQLKKQLDDVTNELEKAKLKLKEQERQNINYKEFKEKYEQLKTSEKQLQEEVRQLNEKNKLLKNESSRHQFSLKELKDKSETSFRNKQTDNEVQDLLAQIKRFKEELNRKDTLIKNYKAKIEDKSFEIDSQKMDFSQKYAQTVQELEKEMRKQEQLKINQKKYENQVQMLLHLLKRIYRENYLQAQKKNQPQKQSHHAEKFSESLNILNLAPEDLDDFLEPNQSTMTVKKQSNKELERFEQECSNPEYLDANIIYNMMNNLIQERLTQ